MNIAPPARTKEEFLEGAGEYATEQAPATVDTNYPWEEPGVREDVIKSINLRLTEPYILKLQYLADKTSKSQQQIIRDILLPQIDAEVKKMTK